MKRFIKKTFDFFGAFLLLLVLSPLMLLLFLITKTMIGNPVFFIQRRPGKNGKVFKIYKFRTMTDKRDEKGFLLPDSERLTSFGVIMRKFSLDELPQLFNVLKGELSFVGPRPLLVEYLELYSEEQKRRHEVTPGISGWAQVKGRNSITWEEKFKLDVWYVDNWSLWLDVKILFLTVHKVIKRDGISSSDSVTMPYFKGEES